MDRRTALRTLAAATALPLASPAGVSGLLEARRTLRCTGSGPRFTPAALTGHQLELVKRVADVILPPTRTPGAVDVGVHEFIDLIVAEWFDAAEAAVFVDGLAELDRSAAEIHGAPFLECAPGDQVALVEELDQALAELHASNAAQDVIAGTFFHWMKRLTLTGYFTSEEGAASTGFRTVPGTFEGCLIREPAP